MFGNTGKKGGKPCNTIDTLIGANTELKGDIVFSGGLRIDGTIKGNVSAKSDNSGSTLVLSERAVIQGDVTVPHIVINGVIRGQVRASERVELQGKAEITGDVLYKDLQMSSGAVVNGKLVCEAALTEVPRLDAPKLKAVGPAGAVSETEPPRLGLTAK